MAHKWKNGVPVEIDPTKYVPGKGTRKYVNANQCITVFKKGARAGTRCSWYAMKDSLHCRRHRDKGQSHHLLTPEQQSVRSRAMWARLHALEKEHPGFIKQWFGDRSGAGAMMRERYRLQRAQGIPGKPIKVEALIGQTEKPVVDAAKTLIRELSTLPVIDRPFEELTMPEQFTQIRRKALERTFDILREPYRDADGVVNPKIMSIIKDAAARANTLGVKVDTNALVGAKLDRMTDLLARLKGEDAKVIDG